MYILYIEQKWGISYFGGFKSWYIEMFSKENKHKAMVFKTKKEIAKYFGYKTLSPILKVYKIEVVK